jgi:hypothetical protein
MHFPTPHTVGRPTSRTEAKRNKTENIVTYKYRVLCIASPPAIEIKISNKQIPWHVQELLMKNKV